MVDWESLPDFNRAEFVCKHSGRCHMDKDFMRKLQALRTECGFIFDIKNGSGYRHPTHPIEAAKHKQGEHCYGKAVDIPLGGRQADKLIELSYKHGFTRRGISQNGGAEYIHLGTGLPSEGFPSGVWSY